MIFPYDDTFPAPVTAPAGRLLAFQITLLLPHTDAPMTYLWRGLIEDHLIPLGAFFEIHFLEHPFISGNIHFGILIHFV